MNRHLTHGFTLIEVVIALAILSIGLLGIGAMQVVGLRSNSGAVYRSQAILIASEMVERMNANPVAVSAGTFAAVDSANVACTNAGGPIYPIPYCSAYYGAAHVDAETCTPAEMAAFDIYVVSCGNRMGNWFAQDGIGALPNGQMTIVCPAVGCPPGSGHVITVSWADRNEDGTADTKSINVPFIPNTVATIAVGP